MGIICLSTANCPHMIYLFLANTLHPGRKLTVINFLIGVYVCTKDFWEAGFSIL